MADNFFEDMANGRLNDQNIFDYFNDEIFSGKHTKERFMCMSCNHKFNGDKKICPLCRSAFVADIPEKDQ